MNDRLQFRRLLANLLLLNVVRLAGLLQRLLVDLLLGDLLWLNRLALLLAIKVHLLLLLLLLMHGRERLLR